MKRANSNRSLARERKHPMLLVFLRVLGVLLFQERLDGIRNQMPGRNHAHASVEHGIQAS